MLDMRFTDDDRRRYAGYYNNVDHFVQDTLTGPIVDMTDYVPGTTRIDFYEQLIEGDGFKIYDHRRDDKAGDPGPYENALFKRITSADSRMLVLIGGLGAGKSTAVRYLCEMMKDRRAELAAQYPCDCSPCIRSPLLINCDMDPIADPAKCEAEVLMRIRRDAYVRLIDEWYAQYREDASTLTPYDRKVLRRLMIANDIYRFAEPEQIEFPTDLHVAELDLDGVDLLEFAPSDWPVRDLVRKYTRAANGIDSAVQHVIRDIDLGRRFTALVLGFWVSRHPRTPQSALIIDNIDQQPTDNIAQIVNDLNALDLKHDDLRILIPLRPSSIVPSGFTHNIRYMYHYGANCFDMVQRRISKYILSANRPQLADTLTQHAAPTPIAPEEVRIFRVASYIYAMVCINGMREAPDTTEDIRPAVSGDDGDHLQRISLRGSAVRQLADTLNAIVGTCSRYAVDQLRRYYQHLYAHPAFLRQIEGAGLGMGASTEISIPYGEVIASILGPQETDDATKVTGLANLYVAHESAQPELPTLAKVRVLAFLGTRRRVRVSVVVSALARFGIPVEIAIAALNYLHKKERLLLWFSRNSEVSCDQPDLDQYAVISEHGLAYLRDLVGDFEYVWFCAQQLVAAPTGDDVKGFKVRLSEYARLVRGFAATEWKQMTFRRLTASDAAGSSDAPLKEMLTLYLLYSSFERGLRSASVAVSRRDDVYTAELNDLLDTIIEVILNSQEAFRTYYGSNEYLVTYGRKIGPCHDAAANLLKQSRFGKAHAGLRALIESWNSAVCYSSIGSGEEVLDQRSPDVEWERLVNGIPMLSRPEEVHARASLTASIGPFLLRRQAIRRMLSEQFPSFSSLEQQLRLLISGGKVVRDHAERLAAYTTPLIEWLDKEAEAADSISDQFEANEIRVPWLVTMEEMDQLKMRANRLATCYGELAQRLNVQKTDHLTVRWSV